VSFFWLLFSGCTVSAWLVGYSMGYLRGVRDAIAAGVRDDDTSFSGDWSGRQTGAAMQSRMWRLFMPGRYSGATPRATRGT
jgi:hypothetical protein